MITKPSPTKAQLLNRLDASGQSILYFPKGLGDFCPKQLSASYPELDAEKTFYQICFDEPHAGEALPELSERRAFIVYPGDDKAITARPFAKTNDYNGITEKDEL